MASCRHLNLTCTLLLVGRGSETWFLRHQKGGAYWPLWPRPLTDGNGGAHSHPISESDALPSPWGMWAGFSPALRGLSTHSTRVTRQLPGNSHRKVTQASPATCLVSRGPCSLYSRGSSCWLGAGEGWLAIGEIG